jgi:hypothetical protein
MDSLKGLLQHGGLVGTSSGRSVQGIRYSIERAGTMACSVFSLTNTYRIR